MARHTYTIVLLAEPDGRYSVLVPGLPGCHTYGRTLPQCLDMAKEAIACHIEALQVAGDPIPPDAEEISFSRYESEEGHWFRVTVEV